VKRNALIAAFIAVLLVVVIGGHLYLAEQLVFAPALPSPWRGMALAAIALGGALLVLQPIGERTLPPALARWIAWPSGLWMGFAFYLLMLSLAANLLQMLMGAVGEGGAASRDGDASVGGHDLRPLPWPRP
jgi:hypothetical protein